MLNEKYNELAFYTLGLQDEYFIHQHVVDAFTTQHATHETKTISLIFALVGLYLYVERKYTGKEIQSFHTLMSDSKMDWPQLKLPAKHGEVTIEMVLKENEGDARNRMIEIWCSSIWKAYHELHVEIIKIAAQYQRQ
jgi:hypothetical protein